MATFTIDLLTGDLYLFSGDFTNTGGTAPVSGSTYPEVQYYTDLPSASDYAGEIYIVREVSGSWWTVNRHDAGMYYSTGVAWVRLGDTPSFFSADNFRVFNASDQSTGFKFVTSAISTGAVRSLTVQNSDGTVAYLSDVNLKVNTSLFNAFTGTTAPNTYLKLNQTTPQVVYGGAPQFDGIQFNLTGTTMNAEGKLVWDDDSGTLQFGLPGGNVNLQIGQETVVKVVNKSGSDMFNGQIVYANGSQGNRPTIALASAFISPRAIGMLTENIDNNNSGYVTISGLVHDVNTLAYTAGTTLYLGISAGTYTNVRPPAPYYQIPIGMVLYQHATEGVILFNPKFSYKLEELANVNGTALVESGQFPVWDNDVGYFDFTVNINDYYNKAQIDAYTASTFNRTAVTGLTYTPVSSDRIIALLGTTGGTVHVNLPNISAIGDRACWTFKDEGFNAGNSNVIFSAFTGNFIEKTTYATLCVNGGAITIYNDGATNWYIV